MSALQGYLHSFSEWDDLFLTYYAINPDKTIATTNFTRGEFLILAARAKSFLVSRGIARGDHVCHYFSSNTVEDLAFRLASVFIGSIPVTVNWDADTPERVLYKITVTNCKLILCDSSTSKLTLEFIENNLAQTNITMQSIVDAKNCLISSEGDDKASDGGAMLAMMMMGEGETSIKHNSGLEMSSTRIVIFTSGTTGNPKGVRLSYSNYETNRSTFEQFLQVRDDPSIIVSTVVINPLHHTNSTSFTDWMLRRKGIFI
jgi:long-subunit acyl-CoA synthetase (AMP-forming)